MTTRKGKEPVVGADAAVEFAPLAVSIAQTAILGGVAEQVIHLLSGGASSVQVRPGVVASPKVQEPRWVADEKEPGSSGLTMIPSEDDGELSRLLRTVRERRSSPRRKAKPASL